MKPVKLFNIPQVTDMDMSSLIIALDHLAARVEMSDAELERFESIVLRLETLERANDEAREAAKAEYQDLERRKDEMSCALDHVRVYLEAQTDDYGYLPVMDKGREAHRVALCTIDDALTVQS